MVTIENLFSVDPAGLFARIMNSYKVSGSSCRIVNLLDVKPMLLDTKFHVFAFKNEREDGLRVILGIRSFILYRNQIELRLLRVVP